ncbi:MAG: non-canonical purine NTP pyrophosphatase [bacterium]|nr:non-canonical purine NTP pyrophosphatase [bacterium]
MAEKKDILIATSNHGKAERYRNLVRHIDSEIILHMPQDLGIEPIEVKENGTLKENAEQKALAYLGKVPIPILANDTGFYVEGEGLVENPKRIALGENGREANHEEVCEAMILFWRGIAEKHGGQVEAAWIDEFTLVMPNGSVRQETAQRDVILTNTVFGQAHVQLPVRALYISKATGKPAALHTQEEELLELAPIMKALARLLSPN